MLLLIPYRNMLHVAVDCIVLYATNAYVGIELIIATLHKRDKVKHYAMKPCGGVEA
jgi:hypothetical protein